MATVRYLVVFSCILAQGLEYSLAKCYLDGLESNFRWRLWGYGFDGYILRESEYYMDTFAYILIEFE